MGALRAVESTALAACRAAPSSESTFLAPRPVVQIGHRTDTVGSALAGSPYAYSRRFFLHRSRRSCTLAGAVRPAAQTERLVLGFILRVLLAQLGLAGVKFSLEPAQAFRFGLVGTGHL